MADGASLDGLNGTQKAAMFMLAAGEQHASRLFAKLDLEEIRDITQAMSRLGRISGETVEALLHDFLDRLGGTAGLIGGYHTAKRLLACSLSADKVDAILEDIQGPAGRTVPVSQLLRLGRGAVVELDRQVGESIDILVNNRLVARGEVVILDDRLGVTMTEIIKSEP